MIVKVQWPIATNDAAPRVLIYNEDRSVEWQAPATPQFSKIMHRKLKAFFFAELKGTIIHIGRPAPWQEW